VPASIINMISGHVSIHFGFKGPTWPSSRPAPRACTASALAARMIEYGDADVMVAVAPSPRSPAGHRRLRGGAALSTRNDDPATASRPWDKDRDGFVLGEGAGVMVLEEYEHAKRGAKIYAELAGFGMSGDAHHMTAPDVDGPARACMATRCATPASMPIRSSTSTPTAPLTPLGDLNETNAIKLAFGDHARKLVVNSTKSMTGHLLGWRRRHRVVFTVLAVHHQISPPTINIFNQDARSATWTTAPTHWRA
jgi:3-oxoacyl-[acyl-carrier-protein] synthase II